MGKLFIVSPQMELLRAKLFGQNRTNSWVFYPCDATTFSGKEEVKTWVLEHKPDYVLIHLLDLNLDDLSVEQELSRFFKKHKVPAQFLLPDNMVMSDKDAAALSEELCIEEFLGRSILDPEISRKIESFAEFGHQYAKMAANDLAM